MTATDATLNGLLRAVIAEPDSDDVRLIYADRCEEIGQTERAEFIRVQVALARTKQRLQTWEGTGYNPPAVLTAPRLMTNPQWLELRRRERELFRREWAAGVPDGWFVDYRGPQIEGLPPRALFRRGFVEVTRLSAAEWLAHADALCAATPLREVRLLTRPLVERVQVGLGVCWRFQGRTKMHQAMDAESILTAEWPGIRFTLPELVTMFDHTGKGGKVVTVTSAGRATEGTI